MRFQIAATLTILLTTTVLAQDAGVSSIVSQFDSIKSELYALTTATNSDAGAKATSLGAVLISLIASVSTESDWPAASSILISQAATDSAKVSSLKSSMNSASVTAQSTSSARSSQSAGAGSATSSGLAPMVTAGLSGMMAIGVLGAAVLL